MIRLVRIYHSDGTDYLKVASLHKNLSPFDPFDLVDSTSHLSYAFTYLSHISRAVKCRDLM